MAEDASGSRPQLDTAETVASETADNEDYPVRQLSFSQDSGCRHDAAVNTHSLLHGTVPARIDSADAALGRWAGATRVITPDGSADSGMVSNVRPSAVNPVSPKLCTTKCAMEADNA